MVACVHVYLIAEDSDWLADRQRGRIHYMTATIVNWSVNILLLLNDACVVLHGLPYHTYSFIARIAWMYPYKSVLKNGFITQITWSLATRSKLLWRACWDYSAFLITFQFICTTNVGIMTYNVHWFSITPDRWREPFCHRMEGHQGCRSKRSFEKTWSFQHSTTTGLG